MAINEVHVKSLLQKSRLPGADYVVNPYSGCVHGCVYCYARFIKRFTGQTEAWGAFLDARVNAPDILRKELGRRKEPLKELLFLSSVTDPYQPAEERYRLTRGVLEALLEYQAPISILTKSDLVLRDIDLLKRFENCNVGMSLMTTSDEVAHRMEPRAPSVTRRLYALKALRESGIRTYAFIGPFLPVLTDLEQIMSAVHNLVDEVGVEALNARGGNWVGVEGVLNLFYPDSLPRCKQLIKDDGYWADVEQQARTLANHWNLAFMGFYRH